MGRDVFCSTSTCVSHRKTNFPFQEAMGAKKSKDRQLRGEGQALCFGLGYPERPREVVIKKLIVHPYHRAVRGKHSVPRERAQQQGQDTVLCLGMSSNCRGGMRGSPSRAGWCARARELG